MEKNFGNYLKTLRAQKGLSLHDLQRRTGISNSYLSQIETGKRNIPTFKQLEKISAVYGVNMLDLLFQKSKDIEKRKCKKCRFCIDKEITIRLLVCRDCGETSESIL